MTTNLPRRSLLRRTLAISAAAAVGSQVLSTPGYAASREPDPAALRQAVQQAQQRAQERKDRVLTGAQSKNGWDMEKLVDDRGSIYTRPVPGTPLDVQIRMGDVETVLVHVLRRFHYEIEALREGEVVGWRPPAAVRKSLAESNQASGTAIQIRSRFYPAGSRGGFFPNQVATIRDMLAELDGTVRWGGDDRRVDESLFYLDVKPDDAHLGEVAQRIRLWNYSPGRGAGSAVDVQAPGRRRAAKALEQRQRSAA